MRVKSIMRKPQENKHNTEWGNIHIFNEKFTLFQIKCVKSQDITVKTKKKKKKNLEAKSRNMRELFKMFIFGHYYSNN